MFCQLSGNAKPGFRQCSTHFPTMLSPLSGKLNPPSDNDQPAFRQHTARFPATLNPLSGNAQPILRQRSTHFPTILSPLSGNAAATFLVCKLPRLGRPYGRLIATPTCPPPPQPLLFRPHSVPQGTAVYKQVCGCTQPAVQQ